MIKNSSAHDTAQSALDTGLVILGRTSDWKLKLPCIAPEDHMECEGASIDVLCRMEHPRVALLGGLLTPKECHELISYAANKRLIASGVMDATTGKRINHSARTSSSVFLTRAETAQIDTLEKRLSRLTN